jgi:hypothetical protein
MSKELPIASFVVMGVLWPLFRYSIYARGSMLPPFLMVGGGSVALGLATVNLLKRKEMPRGFFIATQFICWPYAALPAALLLLATTMANLGA